jgi:tetratricopeptide (TPR) repeat protein
MANKAINRKYLMIILFVLSLVVYARTINYGFVWDDERIHLTNNEQLMKGNVKSFWEKPYSGMYIPMSYTAWTIIKNSSDSKKQLSPKVFHLLNIIMHSINCILIFQLLVLLFKNQTQAFFGSLLFMLHPMQVESVAWISEFRGLFSAFFCLLSLISIFNYSEKNSIKVRSFIISKNFIIATILFVFALLAKPSAIVLPFVAVVLGWCFYRINFTSSIKVLSLWLILIIPIIIITKNSQPNELIYTNISLWQRFFIAGDSLFFYLQKLIFPYPLAACYGYTPEIISTNQSIYITTIICFLLTIILFIKRKSNPILFSGFLIIFICLLPVLGFIPFEYQEHSNVADRYIYFAMIGAALFIPVISNSIEKNNYLKYIGGSVLLIFLILNIRQTNTWKNEFSVWDNTLQHYQNSPKVYYNRGVEYSKMGKYDDAITDYTQCLSIQKDYRDALFNRANAYENVNNIQAAFTDYSTYLSIDSTDGSVYYKRSHLYYKEGNINAALNDVKKAAYYNFPVNSKFKNLLLSKESFIENNQY